MVRESSPVAPIARNGSLTGSDQVLRVYACSARVSAAAAQISHWPGLKPFDGLKPGRGPAIAAACQDSNNRQIFLLNFLRRLGATLTENFLAGPQRSQHRAGSFLDRQSASRHLIIREIDLDQSNHIAIRVAYKSNKAYSKMRSVAVSEEKKVEKTQAQILSEAFEGMKRRQPESHRELSEWLATDEGKQATIFEPTLISRWGETGHS
jgi:hypothetical protein